MGPEITPFGDREANIKIAVRARPLVSTSGRRDPPSRGGRNKSIMLTARTTVFRLSLGGSRAQDGPPPKFAARRPRRPLGPRRTPASAYTPAVRRRLPGTVRVSPSPRDLSPRPDRTRPAGRTAGRRRRRRGSQRSRCRRLRLPSARRRGGRCETRATRPPRVRRHLDDWSRAVGALSVARRPFDLRRTPSGSRGVAGGRGRSTAATGRPWRPRGVRRGRRNGRNLSVIPELVAPIRGPDATADARAGAPVRPHARRATARRSPIERRR